MGPAVPPALVVIALVALAVPAAAHALSGRPRGLGTAWLAAMAAAVLAQAAGELVGARFGMVGDAQVALAAAGATLASLGVAAAEAPGRVRRHRR